MVKVDNMNCFRQKTIGFLNFLNAFLVKKKKECRLLVHFIIYYINKFISILFLLAYFGAFKFKVDS